MVIQSQLTTNNMQIGHAIITVPTTSSSTEGYRFRHLSGSNPFVPVRRSTSPNSNEHLILEAELIGKEIQFYLTFDVPVELVVHGNGVELFHGNIKISDAFFSSASGIRTIFASEINDLSYLPESVKTLNPNLRRKTVLLTLEPDVNPVQLKFESKNFHYTDRKLISSGESWQRYVKDVGINYLFSPATTQIGSNYLVVGFSAVNQPGIFGYNYRATTEATGANAIYLLDDFGDQGAYYLMNNKLHYIYDTVQHLIHQVSGDLGIPLSNIILIGSSKGGSAALIHGLGLGEGHVFIGAPQTKIGNFLSKAHPNILKYMSGGITQNHSDYLNDYIYERYSNLRSSPEVTIVVGLSDHHYKGHVVPLQEHLKGTQHSLTINALPGTPHNEIGKAYRVKLLDFLAQNIK